MQSNRMSWLFLTLVAIVAVLGPCAPIAWADDDDDDKGREMTLAGFVDVPGGTGATVTLPLPSGASPVVVNLTFGLPTVTLPVTITTATRVKPASEPITLTDGDRIKVDIHVVGTTLQADRIQVEDFPELELIGTAKNLPAQGVTLPLTGNNVVNFVITLTSGIDLPVRLTASTKVKAHTVELKNGDAIRVEAGVQNNAIVATEIRRVPKL